VSRPAWRPANPGSQRWLVAAVNAIVDHPSLKPVEKLLLLTLARWCDGSGVCSIYVARLAHSVSSTMRWTQVCVSGLVAQGYLVREQRRLSRDRNAANIFRVCLPLAGLGEGGGGRSPDHPLGDLQITRSHPSDRSLLSSGSITYKQHPRSFVGSREAVNERTSVDSVPEELVKLACRFWPAEHPEAARKFLGRIVTRGEPTLDELKRFLRSCSKDPTLDPPHADRGLPVACTAHRFDAWLKRARRVRLAPPTTETAAIASPKSGRAPKWLDAVSAARARTQNTPFPRRRGA